MEREENRDPRVQPVAPVHRVPMGPTVPTDPRATSTRPGPSIANPGPRPRCSHDPTTGYPRSSSMTQSAEDTSSVTLSNGGTTRIVGR